MGTLGHVGTLIRASVTEVLDRAEDPELLVDLIFRHITEALSQARAQVLSSIAEEQLIEGNLPQAVELEPRWEGKAELTAEQGRDDLAPEALPGESASLANAEGFEQQLRAQRDVLAKLQADLRALQIEYEALLAQRDTLVATQRTTAAQSQAGQGGPSMSTIDPSGQLAQLDPSGQLGHIEGKIRAEGARAQAQAELSRPSLDEQLAELERADTIEDELAQLKQRLGKAS
jgi:phage shock protein A